MEMIIQREEPEHSKTTRPALIIWASASMRFLTTVPGTATQPQVISRFSIIRMADPIRQWGSMVLGIIKADSIMPLLEYQLYRTIVIFSIIQASVPQQEH